MEEQQHGLQLIRCQYAARLDPKSSQLLWPPAALLVSIQDELPRVLFGLDQDGNTLPHSQSLAAAYPADEAYQKAFLRELLRRCEEAVAVAIEQDGAQRDDYEVNAILLEHYATLMAQPSGSGNNTAARGNPMESLSSSLPLRHELPPDQRYLTFYFPLKSPQQRSLTDDLSTPSSSRVTIDDRDWSHITLKESTALISGGTTALRTWEASRRLASHLLASPQDRAKVLHPRARVLELGSGTGLVSLVVAKLQQQERASRQDDDDGPAMTATDLPLIVQTKSRENAELNDLASSEHLALTDLDWIEHRSRIEDTQHFQPDEDNLLANLAPTLILGADLNFDPELLVALVVVLRSALEYATRRQRQEEEGWPHRPEALLTCTIRNLSTYARFCTLVEEKGLVAEEVELQRCRVDPPLAEKGREIPPILAFPSSHEEQKEGQVRGLRVYLPESAL